MIAIALSVLTSGVGVAQSAGGAATIVAPGEGAVVTAHALVNFTYTGFSPQATYFAGYLLLDGAWAGSFHRAREATASPNGTLLSVKLDATNVTSGSHALRVHVFTDRDAPVTSAPVTVQLDHAPRLSASASYDLDARRLTVLATVEDEGVPDVSLRSGAAWVNASFTGTRALSLDRTLGPGRYLATLEARDALGQRSLLILPFDVGDRPASLQVLGTRYERGGWLFVEAAATDPDGVVAAVKVGTPLGGGDLSEENGTWAGALRVSPRLGTHAATLTAYDAYGGRTDLNFTFDIAGERVVLFERRVDTRLGAYGDASSLTLAGVAEGIIEICAQSCAPPEETPMREACFASEALCGAAQGAADNLANGARALAEGLDRPLVWQATNLTYDLAASHPYGRAVVRGDWSATTISRWGFCTPQRAPGLVESAADTAVESADAALADAFADSDAPGMQGFRLCRDQKPLFDAAGQAVPHASPPAVGDCLGCSGTAHVEVSSATGASCVSRGEDAACGFATPAGSETAVSLKWAQAGPRTVVLRISGVLV